MNTISSLLVANTFIYKSFEEKIYITELKLTCLMYLLHSNYLFKYGEVIFNEQFVREEEKLILPTIAYKFKCFGNSVIKKFARDAKGYVKMATGVFLDESIDYIWNEYKFVKDTELLNFINSTSLILNNKDNEIIHNAEILADEIKRQQISLNATNHALEKSKCTMEKLLRK